jgi:acetyl-CoA C-acetyltransferase
MFKQPIYIVDGIRTPFLKARGKPGPFSASDLATQAGLALLNRLPIQARDLDEVILGCAAPSVDEVNIGRYVALRLGGDSVTGYTVMRNCASGMQALDNACDRIAAGRAELILAGGVDALSRTPLLYNDRMVSWFAEMAQAKTTGQKLAQFAKLSPSALLDPIIGILRGLTDPKVGLLMGQTAENLAARYKISRAEMDAFSAESHRRAHAAHEGKLLAGEVTPLIDSKGTVYTQDDGVRADSTVEGLAKLKPFFDKPFGNVTAANSSQVTDGAVWCVLASEAAVAKHKLTVLGKIIDSHWAGLDPSVMGLGPVYAAAPLMKRNGISFNDLAHVEINEAFAAQVIACQRAFADREFCQREFGQADFGLLDPAKLNPEGGAVAMGHPVGASGARIVLHALNRMQPGQKALASICIGGGQGGAMLVERL